MDWDAIVASGTCTDGQLRKMGYDGDCVKGTKIPDPIFEKITWIKGDWLWDMSRHNK